MTNKEAIEILSVIRYSPSVDVFNKLPNSDNIIELNYKGAFDLAIKALEERPYGKWIEKVERRGCFAGDKTVYSYTCPFCGVTEFKKYPFCHCGADMRGKEE